MKKKTKRMLGLGIGLVFVSGVIFGAGMSYVLTH